MNNKQLIKSLLKGGRRLAKASEDDESIGVLNQLVGRWSNKPNLQGRGWNMIALPFADGRFHYRLLLNQYNEELKFTTVDEGVANRGIANGDIDPDGDQTVAALSYEQTIEQIASEDSPNSGLAGEPGATIHHEPGLFLNMLNNTTDDLNLARLGTIPHGDSLLALGRSNDQPGAVDIPDISGLPIGVTQSLENPYLEPYKVFNDKPFKDLFNPVHPNQLLKEANRGVDIVKTTILDFDTKIESGGILNIPFVERQADVSEMTSTFWIQELAEKDASGKPKLRLQYTQTVFLDFFDRNDGTPGRIRWPHISINTLEKIA